MKKLFVAFSLLAGLSANAFAQTTSSKEFAKIVTSGGLIPPTVPNANGVQIMMNGDVLSFKHFMNGETRLQKLGHLEPVVMKALKAEVSAIVSADLIDAEAGQPGCMDAPTVTITAKNKLGIDVALKQWAECHTLLREDQAGRSIIEIISGFDKIYIGY